MVINGAKIIFSTNIAGTTGHPHPKKLNVNKVTCFTKVNSNTPNCEMQNYRTSRRQHRKRPNAGGPWVW